MNNKMKFLQTLNATFINIEEISKIDHEWVEKQNRYYSYVYTKDGTKLDFLDIPDTCQTNDGLFVKFDGSYILEWHMIALEMIIDYPGSVVPSEYLEEHSWRIFWQKFGDKISKYPKID